MGITGFAGVQNAQPGSRGHGSRRAGRTQRVLLLAQVPDHADIEGPFRRTAQQARVRHRLVNDVDLGEELRRQCFPDQLVQRDQGIGVLE